MLRNWPLDVRFGKGRADAATARARELYYHSDLSFSMECGSFADQVQQLEFWLAHCACCRYGGSPHEDGNLDAPQSSNVVV